MQQAVGAYEQNFGVIELAPQGGTKAGVRTGLLSKSPPSILGSKCAFIIYRVALRFALPLDVF